MTSKLFKKKRRKIFLPSERNTLNSEPAVKPLQHSQHIIFEATSVAKLGDPGFSRPQNVKFSLGHWLGSAHSHLNSSRPTSFQKSLSHWTTQRMALKVVDHQGKPRTLASSQAYQSGRSLGWKQRVYDSNGGLDESMPCFDCQFGTLCCQELLSGTQEIRSLIAMNFSLQIEMEGLPRWLVKR